MFYPYQKQIAENLLKSLPLDAVYVNCKQLTRGKDTAVFCDGDFVGYDDTKGFYAYIRISNNIRYNYKETEGENYLYNAGVPIRIVLCMVRGAKLSENSVFKRALLALQGTKFVLNEVWVDKQKLYILENQTGKDFSFDTDTIYFAIDTILAIPFSLAECQNDLDCTDEKNVLQKCDFLI
jgi:hypothetical protein